MTYILIVNEINPSEANVFRIPCLIATVVDDNIVSLKITPHVKKNDPSTGGISWDDSGNCNKLPTYVKIELQMIDDDPSVRAAYKEASSSERSSMIRTYTRIVEINRGQYYE